MKRIAVALGALAFAMGAMGASSQMSAYADEAKVEEAYKPLKDEPEINETENQKKISRSMRKKKMKSKLRRMRKGNNPRAGGHRAARCSSKNCR